MVTSTIEIAPCQEPGFSDLDKVYPVIGVLACTQNNHLYDLWSLALPDYFIVLAPNPSAEQASR